MKELVVVAIGGNSIIKDNASQSIEHQAEAVKAVADTVLEMLASDYDIVLTHGQRAAGRAGFTPCGDCPRARRATLNAAGELCSGYARRHRLSDPAGAEQPTGASRREKKKAVTVVTQVEVDKKRSGFCHPTNPSAAFFSESQRDETTKGKP